MAENLWLPIGRVQSHHGVPETMRGSVSGAVEGSREANDLARRLGGGHVRPKAPILIWGADNRTPILLMGDGETEASELQDLALEALERQQESVNATGRGADYDAFRERQGLMEKAKVDEAVREAIRDRIKKHKRNSRTDPFRQPQKPLGSFQGVDMPKKEAE